MTINSPIIPYSVVDLFSGFRLADFVNRFFKDPMDEQVDFVAMPWQEDFYDALRWDDKSVMVKTPRGFGKTVAIASAGAALIEVSKHWVGFFSMSQDQSDEIMRYAAYFHDTSTYPYKPNYADKSTNTEKRFDNGSRLFSFPISAARVHGKRLHYAFVDEMSRIEDEFIRVSIRPTLRKIGVKFVGVSTPFGMVGEFYRCVNDTQNYSVFDLGPLDAPFVTKENMIRELRDYGVYLNDDVARLPNDKFLEVLDSIEDYAVSQELMGKFISPGDRVFDPQLIARAYDTGFPLREKGEPSIKYTLGADFGKVNDRTVFVVGHEYSGYYWVDYVESWLESDIPRGKQFYPFVRERINHICTKFNTTLFVPDGTGVGAPVLDEVEYDFKKYDSPPRMHMHNSKKKGFVFTEDTKLDLVDNLVQAFQDHKIRIPWHSNVGELKALENELLSFTYEISGSRIKKLHYGVQNAHDDRVMALALMVYGLKARKPWMFALVKGF